MYVYIYLLIHTVIQQKLTQYCKKKLYSNLKQKKISKWLTEASRVVQWVKNLPTNAGDARDSI